MHTQALLHPIAWTMHSSGVRGSKGPGTAHTEQPWPGARGSPAWRHGVRQRRCIRGPNTAHSRRVGSARPAALPPCCQGGPVAWLTWARGPPGPGPLCGRMAGRAGAQSKLNLHLGVPSGRSSQRSHRSLLMASSKCGAAASAPRVRAPPPSPRALCKMVFTKVNIGRGARPGHREPPLASPARAASGLPRPRSRGRNCPWP